jgi:tetratricopeptide (TPR) repeat protein
MNEHVPVLSVAARAGNRAKLFVSYSRKDLAFAQMLVGALAERGFDAFLDKMDIAPGEPWKERLASLIAAADTVVFAVSPDSIASSICAWELEESARLGKRVIPVVTRRIADADAPPALGRLNFVFCAEGDDEDAALATLDTALRTDLAWVREHTRLGELARRWNDQGRGKGATLRGADLEAAERWLDRRPADANAPTDLHQDLIRASRRASSARQRTWVGGSLLIALLAIGLAGFAEISRREAQRQRNEAQAQRDRAERTLTLATGTANSLVFDLADRFRDVAGVPASTIKDILDRARQLQEQLLGAGESTPALRKSQADGLIETAITLLALGETRSALAAAQQAREILQLLLAQQPDSADLQRELSVSQDWVGDVQLAQGDLPAALASYQASQAISERLANSDPGNASWQRDLSVAYAKVGDMQVAQGDLAAAMTSLQARLVIAERLTKTDPGKALWQRDLSISYGEIGNVQLAQGDLPAALISFQAGQVIFERLAKSDPGKALWQRDLSVFYERVGDVQVAQGNLSAALTSYEAKLAVAERLAKSDPGNALWQRDLSVSYEKVGDAQMAQGDLAAALTSYQASLDIREHLAKSDASNVSWQHDLSVSYAKLAEAYGRAKQPSKAREALTAGRAIIARLVEQFPDWSRWKQDLSWFDTQIATLEN